MQVSGSRFGPRGRHQARIEQRRTANEEVIHELYSRFAYLACRKAFAIFEPRARRPPANSTL